MTEVERAELARLLSVAKNLAAELTDPGTEAFAAIYCAEQLLSRALASDPAPGEQPAAYHGLGNAAIGAGEPGTAYQSAAPADQVVEERRAIADEARRYAGHYPQASDGRNTFILLAEWIEARGAAPAHPTEPGEVERAAVSSIDLHQKRQRSDVCPACNGAGELVIWGAKVVSSVCRDCDGTGIATLSAPQPKGETP